VARFDSTIIAALFPGGGISFDGFGGQKSWSDETFPFSGKILRYLLQGRTTWWVVRKWNGTFP
jgi:hypothetical protein